MKMIMDEAHPQIEYCLFITRIDLIERNQYHFRTFDSEPKKNLLRSTTYGRCQSWFINGTDKSKRKIRIKKPNRKNHKAKRSRSARGYDWPSIELVDFKA